MSYFQILLLLVVLLHVRIDGFAMHMTRKYCDRSLSPGTVIMGKEAVLDGERSLRVTTAAGDELEDGAVVSGESRLVISLQPSTYQMVLEVESPSIADGVAFADGRCDGGRRTNSNNVELLLSEELQRRGGEVTLRGAWAKTYADGVHVVPEMVLRVDPTHNGEL